MHIKRFVLLLALCAILPAAGRAENRDVFPVAEDGLPTYGGMALVDGRLLLPMRDGLYAYVPGQDAPRRIAPMPDSRAWGDREAPRYDLLLPAEGALYALDMAGGRLYRAGLEGDTVTLGETVPLDLGGMLHEEQDFTYIDRPSEVLLSGGYLYMIVRDYRSGSGQPQLKRFSLSDGQRRDYALTDVVHMAAYKDGALLVMRLDERPDREPASAMLSVLDPETAGLTDLGAMDGVRSPDAALGYDADRDILYWLYEGRLYRRTAQDPARDELCAYLSSFRHWGIVSGAITPLEQGVAVLTDDNLFIRDADPAGLPDAPLTVYGDSASPTHQRAQARMPEVPVQFMERGVYYENAQQLGQALAGGEDAIDIYFLDYTFIDMKNLMAKGYADDLSGSAALTAYAQRVYPALREAGMPDGRLMAVPVEVGLDDVMMGYTERFQQAGLEMPEDFTALCRLIGDWPGDTAEAHPELTPLQTEEYRSTLFYYAFRLYRSLRNFQGAQITFDDPLFRQMMQALEAIDTRDLDQKIDWQNIEESQEFFAREPLMEMRFGMRPDMLRDTERAGVRLLALAAAPGEPAPVPLVLRVAAVNPRSAHRELAIRYLEHYVAELDGPARVALMPDENAPVPNPRYEQIMQDMDDAIAGLEKALESAEPAARAEMEGRLAEMKKNREGMADYARYLLNEKAIAAYRALMETSFLQPYDPMQAGGEDVYALYNRYLQGQIDLDTMIREADAKLRLMRLENQ